MVCLEDISLSPLAAGLLNFAAVAKELAEHLEIDSAGLNGNHIGQQPLDEILATAINHGFQLTHEARQLDSDDLEYFDEVLVMDSSMLDEVLAKTKNSIQKEKVRLITEYDPRKKKPSNVLEPKNLQLDELEELYEHLWYCCMGFLGRVSS